MQVPQPRCPVSEPLHTSRSPNTVSKCARVTWTQLRARRPPHRRRPAQGAARGPPATPDDHPAAAATAPARPGQDAPQAPRARAQPRPSRPGSSTSDSNCSWLALKPARAARSPVRRRRLPHRPLHHHYRRRKAGVHRPRRKVRHNGCRDRRSRWPPPWSTLDMSNADFDTPNPKSSGPPGDPGSPVQAIENPQKPGHAARPTSATQPITTSGPRQHGNPPSPVTAQTPVSTGDSPSVQPAPRVPSEELHPERKRSAQ